MGRSERTQGRRLRALADAYHRTIKFGLRGVSLQEFASAFPGEPERLLEVVYDAYKQVGSSVHPNVAATGELAAQERRRQRCAA